VRCPECGADFEEGDLRLERLPGDWTPWGGLARAAGLLAMRSLLVIPVWALVVGCAAFTVDLTGAVAAAAFLVLAIIGYGIGQIYGRGVVERAGFASIVVTALAAAICLVALATAVGLATIVQPKAAGIAPMAAGAPWLFATIVIVKITLYDD
jgi:hypothetical protein